MIDIISRVVAGIIAIVFAVLTILAEQKVERTRSARSTASMLISLCVYCASMIAVLE